MKNSTPKDSPKGKADQGKPAKKKANKIPQKAWDNFEKLIDKAVDVDKEKP